MRDADIRRILRTTSLEKYISDENSKVVDELHLPVTKSRIDIAVVNGRLHGFEIKSARDTLVRLPHQIEGYSKVFDYLTIVTEEKYYHRLLDFVPDWIGIQVCSTKSNGASVIKTVKKGKLNKSQDGFFIAKLLWRKELLELLSSEDIKHRKKDRTWLLCEALSDNIPVKKLSKLVRQKLKEREDWKIKECYL